MLVSVVICTLGRTESLLRTLAALRYQTRDEFEVLVVSGPDPSGGTEQALAELDLGVRFLAASEPNLSRSRNLGIAAAAGDLVAFLDDDAVPEASWLEQLAAAYDGDVVAGSGGLVYDHTGTRLQYRYSLSDRVGNLDFSAPSPAETTLQRGADPFLYLQGTNMSFRRELLVELGGFDEEIEYNFDEAELCLRVIDAGFRLRPLAGAAVHHKSLPSPMRGAGRAIVDPYAIVKNRAYFALRHGLATRAEADVLATLRAYADELSAGADRAREAAGDAGTGADAYRERAEAGLAAGIAAARRGLPRTVPLPEPDRSAWQPFARLRAAGSRRVAVLASERATATALAAEGHDVHLLIGAEGGAPRGVEFEAGVWSHRYPVKDRRLTAVASHPRRRELYAAAAQWLELAELDRQARLATIVRGRERVTLEQLRSELLAGIGGASHRTVDDLLDPTTYPVDRRAELTRSWALPAPSFVGAVYGALLERAPAEPEIAMWAPAEEPAGWRERFVGAVLGSTEAGGLCGVLAIPARVRQEIEALPIPCGPMGAAALEILEDRLWQMSGGERAAVEGMLAWCQPAVAIEIGSADGSALRRIAAHAGEAHSFDLVAPSLEMPDNVVLHTGDSHELLPQALAEFAARGTNIDFVLVDGDHSPEGVRRDLEDLLDSPALAASAILIHDTANERVRAGLDSVRYEAWPKVVHVDLDWVPGHLFAEPALHNELWFGLGLVLIDSARLAYGSAPVYEQRYHPAGPLLAQIAASVRAREIVPPEPEPPEVEAGKLRRRAAQLERELAIERERAETLGRDFAGLEDRWQRAERALESITGSVSWRLTSPLRAAKRGISSGRN